MKREFLEKLGLEKEVIDKVMSENGKDLENAKAGAANAEELKKQLKAANDALAERDDQLKELKKGVGDNEELKGKISALEESNKKQKADYEAQIQQIKINTAVESALSKAGARNLKAAKAMLEMGKVSLDDKGEAVGLKEQIDALKGGEDTSFLFTAENVGGFVPGQGGEAPVDTSKMNYEQLASYIESNPNAII